MTRLEKLEAEHKAAQELLERATYTIDDNGDAKIIIGTVSCIGFKDDWGFDWFRRWFNAHKVADVIASIEFSVEGGWEGINIEVHGTYSGITNEETETPLTVFLREGLETFTGDGATAYEALTDTVRNKHDYENSNRT